MAEWDIMLLWGFIFLLSGAVGQRVNYPPSVCAVKGSTVTLPCTFTPLDTYNYNGKKVRIKVIRVRWCQNHEICQRTTPNVYDSDSPNDNPRYKYLGDMERNCTLQITDINMKDNAILRFRIEVNHTEGHFTETSGVKVNVNVGTKMTINSSSGDRQTTGEKVTLRCSTICTFAPLEVTWFKDGQDLLKSGPVLHLGKPTAKDSGNYTCALKNRQATLSLPYSLTIKEKEGVPLLVYAVSGSLSALFILIMILCIIKRKRAASKRQSTLGDQGEHKHLYGINSNFPLTSEAKSCGHVQETSQAMDDVNYASVQFQYKNKDRAVQPQETEAVIYSSVASKG